MLIGKINKSNRERLMVTVLESKGTKVVDLRVYSVMDDGELMPTPSGVSLSLEQVEPIMGFLKEAKKRVSGNE